MAAAAVVAAAAAAAGAAEAAAAAAAGEQPVPRVGVGACLLGWEAFPGVEAGPSPLSLPAMAAWLPLHAQKISITHRVGKLTASASDACHELHCIWTELLQSCSIMALGLLLTDTAS